MSRTFALTIPELPPDLRDVVANGYLLCRIADTIEDDPVLATGDRRRLHDQFVQVVGGTGDPALFAERASPLLSRHVLPDERELVRSTARVLGITRGFRPRQRAALARCVRIMCEGMDRYQPDPHRRGLEDLGELEDYCYHVAGVVGEMLTELFCDHSPRIDERRRDLEQRTVSFGVGLQMTNVLKDVWDDLERGACWLPRRVFSARGFDLHDLEPGHRSREFEAGLGELIAIAHGHLREALEYSLIIPPDERGIRRFCLWALGMAALTLRKIHRRPGYRTSSEVKITRRSVKATVLASNMSTGSDRMLRLLFSMASSGLPVPKRVAVG